MGNRSTLRLCIACSNGEHTGTAIAVHVIDDRGGFKRWMSTSLVDLKRASARQLRVWPSPVAVITTPVTLCKTALSVKSQPS